MGTHAQRGPNLFRGGSSVNLKSIPGFPNYSITRTGRVFSKPRKNTRGSNLPGKWLKPGYHPFGYPQAGLRKQEKCYTKLIHRLVLETFVGPCPPGMECRHLDGNPSNNSLKNLCWGTRLENMQDAARQGAMKRGEEHWKAKMTAVKVRRIRKLYSAGKITCRNLGGRDLGLFGRVCPCPTT